MKKLPILLLAGVLALASGCQSYLDINVDPNRPNDASLSTLLPTVEQATATFNYQTAISACQYAQQIGGGINDQSPDRMEGAWSTLYLTLVPNLNVIINKAQSTSPAYVGIAKVLLAYNLGMATTFWENIPYSQADKALSASTFRPTFDTQETVVSGVQTLLDEAIVELRKPATASQSVPKTDDLVYGGDLAKWLRFAYTVKARFFMNTTKKNAQQAATAALAALGNGMTGNGDDFVLTYAATNGIINPWRQIALANNTGNFSVFQGAYFIDLMNTVTYPTADPRLPLVAGSLRAGFVYATPADYRGTQVGSSVARNVDFTVNTWYNTATAPLVMMTFAEAEFLEAEARFLLANGTRTSRGSTAEAYAAYRNGITAHLTQLGVPTAAQTAYLSATAVNMGAANLKLENIMAEKYKALFLVSQVWNDMRRYDFDPAVYRGLALPDKQFLNIEANGNWAQRVLYPSTESARNADVVQQNVKKFTDKMWLF